jgi:hypothetical protein
MKKFSYKYPRPAVTADCIHCRGGQSVAREGAG